MTKSKRYFKMISRHYFIKLRPKNSNFNFNVNLYFRKIKYILAMGKIWTKLFYLVIFTIKEAIGLKSDFHLGECLFYHFQYEENSNLVDAFHKKEKLPVFSQQLMVFRTTKLFTPPLKQFRYSGGCAMALIFQNDPELYDESLGIFSDSFLRIFDITKFLFVIVRLKQDLALGTAFKIFTMMRATASYYYLDENDTSFPNVILRKGT